MLDNVVGLDSVSSRQVALNTPSVPGAHSAREQANTGSCWTRLYDCCHRPSGRLLEPGGGGSVAVASFLRYAALHGGCYNPGRCGESLKPLFLLFSTLHPRLIDT